MDAGGGVEISNIDAALINALIQPDQYGKIGKNAPLKRIVRFGKLDYETEVNIGEKRTADILVTILTKPEYPKVVVEVENDRKFDTPEILRKLKKDNTHKHYPTKVIIPKRFKGDAYLFQNSGFYVWYWTAICKWFCQECKKITTSTLSSLTPNRCPLCKKGGNLLRWAGAENIKFEEAENNPTKTYEEYKIQVLTGRRKYW